jgi:ribosomal protein L37AE/L43A
MSDDQISLILSTVKSDPDGDHDCPKCGKKTPNERYILVGTMLCTTCTVDKPIYGVVEYGHKTGGVLIITESKEEFDQLRKPANQRR